MSDSNSESKATLDIILDGKSYVVRPFTFDQVEQLHVLGVDFEPFDNEENTRKYYSRARDIISAAMIVDHPEMKPETLCKIRVGSFTHIVNTVREIMIFSGIWKRASPTDSREPATGEAKAAP